MDTKLDQNNNSAFQETPVSSTHSDHMVKQYDSTHSDDEDTDGKKQNKRGVSIAFLFCCADLF